MIQVVCAIILKGNKVLITQRSEKMTLPLKWEFPGGKIEKEENEAQALIREIKEELNIDIQPLKKISAHIHDYGTFQINLIAFMCEYVSGEIKLLEHKNFEFISLKEISSYDMAEADLPIIEKLKSELKDN